MGFGARLFFIITDGGGREAGEWGICTGFKSPNWVVGAGWTRGSSLELGLPFATVLVGL